LRVHPAVAGNRTKPNKQATATTTKTPVFITTWKFRDSNNMNSSTPPNTAPGDDDDDDHHHQPDLVDHQQQPNNISCYRRFCDECCHLAFFDVRIAVAAPTPATAANTKNHTTPVEEEESRTSRPTPPPNSSSNRMMVHQVTMVVDIPRSFSIPQQQAQFFSMVLVVKFILWSLILSDIIMGWAVIADNPGFYLAYVTHWTLLISFFYMTLSLLHAMTIPTSHCCCFCNSSSSSSSSSSNHDPPYNNNIHNNEEWSSSVSCRIKLTWALFTVSAHAEILVTLLFWLLVYDSSSAISYPTIMSHGIVLLLVIIDGLVINRIPIRIKHFWFCSLYYLLYIVWSIIHSFTGIENPDTASDSSSSSNSNTNTNTNTNANDDADADVTTSIYAALDWDGDDVAGTIITVVLALGVASPILFLLLWFLALYNPRTCRFDGSNRKCIIKDVATLGGVAAVQDGAAVPAVEEEEEEANDDRRHRSKSGVLQVEAKGTYSTDSAFTQ
jgi:hypothetical protein